MVTSAPAPRLLASENGTRMHADKKGWTGMALSAATGLDQSQCRFGLHLRLSLLIRVHLFSHFYVPSGTHASLAKERHAGHLESSALLNLVNHRSPRLFSDALPVTRCFA